MEIKNLEDFEAALKDSMEDLFGDCKYFKGVLRSIAEHLGVCDTSVIIEAAFENGPDPDVQYPILHFHATLAQRIEEEIVPGILRGLNELNTVISAGAFPSFGCFGYYAPLHQIYLSYRMPVSPGALEAGFDNACYYLGSLSEQLDLFADFIIFLCQDPEEISMGSYMDYLDSVADLNDLKARADMLEELAVRLRDKEKAGDGNGAGNVDVDEDKDDGERE